ncbi:hypothetical protein LCGC14_2739120 [marine sediment metagenome]|uniref:HD domain-containing protein n=1 Tax=marine sediment metagenome TaxID=412755 RepID=A0A0F8Z4Y2_9ZZZZ
MSNEKYDDRGNLIYYKTSYGCEVWNEYNENISDEAKLVHEVDKFEMVIQALSYANDGIEKEKLEPFVNSAKSQINSKQLKEILDKLLQ